MADDVYAYAYAYSSAFSLDISMSTSTKRTKKIVLLVLVLVLCASSLPCACAYDCVVGVLTTVMPMLVPFVKTRLNKPLLYFCVKLKLDARRTIKHCCTCCTRSWPCARHTCLAALVCASKKYICVRKVRLRKPTMCPRQVKHHHFITFTYYLFILFTLGNL